MKVRFKRGWRRTFHTLTPGNVYRVIGIEADMFRIVDDTGGPVLFAPQAFQIVDAALPADWISTRGEEGERYACPPELEQRGLFEDWHDRDPGARSKLSGYLHHVCWREAEAEDTDANTYQRVEMKPSGSDGPLVQYVELDEERLEVRKVEVFADGTTNYAEGRGASGDTKLGEHPVPALGEMTGDPELAPVTISRAEFEAVWDRVAHADDD